MDKSKYILAETFDDESFGKLMYKDHDTDYFRRCRALDPWNGTWHCTRPKGHADMHEGAAWLRQTDKPVCCARWDDDIAITLML